MYIHAYIYFIHACMHKCMYVYSMHKYTDICIDVCIHISVMCMYLHTHMPIHVCHICMHVCNMCMYIHTYMDNYRHLICLHIHTCMSAKIRAKCILPCSIYTFISIIMYVHVFIYNYICMCNTCIHGQAYIHMSQGE